MRSMMLRCGGVDGLVFDNGFQGGEEGSICQRWEGLLGRVVGHDDQQFAGLEMERGDEDGPDGRGSAFCQPVDLAGPLLS